MRKLFAFALFILIVGGAARLWYQRQIGAPDSGDTAAQVIQIPSGMSADDIAKMLEEKGLIRSAWAFGLYTKSRDLSTHLQAGNFTLMPSMTVEELLKALTQGEVGEVSVTIPEGFTVSQIDALLTEKQLIKAGEFIACARSCDFSAFKFVPKAGSLAKRGGRVEGYLFPDTYFVAPATFDAETFLKRLLSTFQERVAEGLSKDIASSGHSLHEVMTMASLIEEETRTGDERAVVSGILWNRFDASMGLGVDATIRYVLEKPTQALTRADLDTDSPYNLRKYRGLPPGPIANPGIGSIKAALNPSKTSYMYYLHGSDGKIRYAETNDEHNANKAKYL